MGISEIYKFASERTPKSREFLCQFCSAGGGARPIDERGDTVLHLLAIAGNTAAFKELFRLEFLGGEALRKKNVDGDTALHEAARFGEVDIVEMMMSVATDLASVRNKLGETPLYVAAARGKRHVFTLLLLHSDCMARRYDGRTVLHAAVAAEYYSLAFTILETCPDLANTCDEKGVTALHILAATPSSFRSGSPYVLQNLGMMPSIILQFMSIIIYSCIPVMYSDSNSTHRVEEQHNKTIGISILKRSYFAKIVLGMGWFKEIDYVKQKHIVALALSKRLIEEGKDWRNHYMYFENTDSEARKRTNPLILATKHGISELVLEILKKYTEAESTFDDNGRNILHIAVEHKHKCLYEQLKTTIVHKDRLMTDVDYQGNTILHLATNVGCVSNIPLGANDQMAWDWFWFKCVRYDSYPHFLRLQNMNGKTAGELFKENHSALRERSEKAIKDMNGALMLVSGLIATVNFAVLFAVPGGFNENDGHPNLLDSYKSGLNWFVIYAGNSLFASLIALATLISVQLSRFLMEDFYILLPVKFLIVCITLFLATTTSLTTCYQAILLDNLLLDRYTTYLMIACFMIILVSVDPIFLLFTYMYDVVRNSLAYKRQEI